MHSSAAKIIKPHDFDQIAKSRSNMTDVSIIPFAYNPNPYSHILIFLIIIRVLLFVSGCLLADHSISTVVDCSLLSCVHCMSCLLYS